MSQPADARLRRPNCPRRLWACGLDHKSSGSPACRRARGYWLNLTSAPTIKQFNSTWGVVVGMDPVSYDRRYCYERRDDAV